MTDEQAVKGRWPGAEMSSFGQVWKCSPRTTVGVQDYLGDSWHKARQHPSVVQWEREQEAYQNPHSKPIDVSPIAELEATIAEQAARIEELEAQVKTQAMISETWFGGALKAGKRAETAEARVAELEAQKDGEYTERDKLVCALSKLFPSTLERHPESDTGWDDDWRWIVFINLPAGQASWHIHDSELAWFDHLDRHTGVAWDGHTTETKYDRLEKLKGENNGDMA